MMETISKEDISKFNEICNGLKVEDSRARHELAGIVSADEFDIGV